MVAAIESRLGGASLRRLWDGLDELQRLAVGEALHDADGFEAARFEAKYGALPSGFGRRRLSRRIAPAPLPPFRRQLRGRGALHPA